MKMTAPGEEPLLLIAGIDARTGLEHVAGDRAFYLRLLARFACTHRDGAHALRAFAAALNWQQMVLLAHNLCGSAAAIGAAGLRRAAMQLEQNAEAQAPGVLQAAERLACELEQVVGALDRHFAAPAAWSVPARQDAGRACAARDRLGAMLAAFSGDAPEFFDESREALSAVLPRSVLAQLAGCIERYEFDAARVLLVSPLPGEA